MYFKYEFALRGQHLNDLVHDSVQYITREHIYMQNHCIL